MLNVRPILGKLIAYTGTSPGPASGITYSVQAQYADVEAPFRVDGIVPVGFRWPGDFVWTDAERTVRGENGVPCKVHGIEVGDHGASFTLWFFGECPFVQPCEGAVAANGMRFVRDPKTGRLVPITVLPPDGPPIISGTVGSPAGFPAPPGGGDT